MHMTQDNNQELWNSFMDWHVDRYNRDRARGRVTYDTLEFPIRWDRSIPLLQHLYYIFTYYTEELEEYDQTHHKLLPNSLNEVRGICNSVLNILRLARQGQAAAPKLLESIKGLMKDCIYPIDDGTDFYRLRNEQGLMSKNDFMHVPFDKLHLCNSMRFSMPGEPCLYLGYTKDVCRKELAKPTGGSMGHFKTKEELKVVDLTLYEQADTDTKIKTKTIDMFKLWPILAACYVAPEETANFKEEYVFPQIIMKLIKDQNIDGIRYYTCRNRNLDPSSTDYMNVALFANAPQENDQEISLGEHTFNIIGGYDKELEKKLDFIE